MPCLPRLQGINELRVQIVGADLVEADPGPPMIPDLDLYDPFGGVCDFYEGRGHGSFNLRERFG